MSELPLSGTETHCPYCALQCAMTLSEPAGRAPSGALLLVQGREFPTNRKGLCQKGWTSPAVLNAADRLTTPLVRGASGRLLPTSWDDALDLIAARLHDLQRRHGHDAVAVFGGGGLTNEKAYTLGKFARVALRTRFVDYNGRFCMAAAATAGNRAFGMDRGLPFPLADLASADAILLLGSNLADTMPPAVQHLAGARARGGLVVVDPRASGTAALTADGAGLHLQPVPGTDLALLLGLLHVVLVEGLADSQYLARRTTGLDGVRKEACTWWPERVEQVTGVAAQQVRRVARLLADASPGRGGGGAYVLTGRGVEQHTQGTATVAAAINLALTLGLPGRRGSGYGCITGQGNGQGGREHGQKADQLPGYRRIDDPAAREHVASVWGIEAADLPGPGVPAVELLHRLGTAAGPHALLLHGSNLLVSAPNTSRVRARLAALELLVVSDVVLSETAAVADVVLPVPQWAEEDGTVTTLEGRVVRRRRAIGPPAGVRTELEVWSSLAQRLGCAAAFPTDPRDVFAELAAASAGGPADYSGIDYTRLDTGAELFWPCPATVPGAPDHPGTPRLFEESFATPDGRAQLVTVSHQEPDEDLRPADPVYLVTGRLLQHYQSGAQTRRVAELVRAAPGGFVQIHPHLAARVGVQDGDPLRVTSARGSLVAPAQVTATLRPDTVFVPFHFSGDALANAVTSDATDPESGMPAFKVCIVSLAAVTVQR